MITHVVIFRTKQDEHKPILREALKKLASIKSLESYQSGKPVVSARPVVDDTFAGALCATFKDEDALNAYQTDPIHLDFNENIVAKYKIKVQVFDIES